MVEHFAVPFALDVRGHARTLEQDTPAEVVQCVVVLVGTRPGERLVVPTYGVDDLTFSTVDAVDDAFVSDAVAVFEPRAGVDIVRRVFADDARLNLTVEVRQ